MTLNELEIVFRPIDCDIIGANPVKSTRLLSRLVKIANAAMARVFRESTANGPLVAHWAIALNSKTGHFPGRHCYGIAVEDKMCTLDHKVFDSMKKNGDKMKVWTVWDSEEFLLFAQQALHDAPERYNLRKNNCQHFAARLVFKAASHFGTRDKFEAMLRVLKDRRLIRVRHQEGSKKWIVQSREGRKRGRHLRTLREDGEGNVLPSD